MRLDEHVIDLLEINDAGLVTDRFNESAQAEIAGAAQEALAGADDQGQGLSGKGVVTQASPIQLGQDKLFDDLSLLEWDHEKGKDGNWDGTFYDGTAAINK